MSLVLPDGMQVTEDLLESHLSTAPLLAEVGHPDLLIRTSGEQRLSNFLCWEAAVSQTDSAEDLCFSPTFVRSEATHGS